jgi:hypothetical protein
MRRGNRGDRVARGPVGLLRSQSLPVLVRLTVRPVRPACRQVQNQRGEGRFQLQTGHDEIDHPVIEQEFGTLKALR